MEKSENLNQLLGILSDSELREYVLEYAEGNAETSQRGRICTTDRPFKKIWNTLFIACKHIVYKQ